MTDPIRIGLVGVGKIARDQHLPVIGASPDYTLVAVASRQGGYEGVPNYRTLSEMIAGQGDLQAVALCQPPQARFEAALAAIEAGLHVFLEKPPGATLAEVGLLAEAARRRGVSLFASWHSRFAPGVEPARSWLSTRRIRSVSIAWMEDVRHWHASPRSTVGFLLHAGTMDLKVLGWRRSLSMPGLSATVGEQIAALARVAGPKVTARIRRTPDPVIVNMVASWPRDFSTARAREVGFTTAETTFDDIIRIHIEDELGGKFVA